MRIVNVSISSSVEEKIAWAEVCYEKLGDQLLEKKGIFQCLGRLKKAIRATRAEMAETGIVDLCRECEQHEGGSCCGVGMENRYDGRLLLINKLLEMELPKKRSDPRDCYFLGEQGCLLQARHVICINYICRKITDRIDPQKISALREKEGVEVDLLFLLNEQIVGALKVTST